MVQKVGRVPNFASSIRSHKIDVSNLDRWKLGDYQAHIALFGVCTCEIHLHTFTTLKMIALLIDYFEDKLSGKFFVFLRKNNMI